LPLQAAADTAPDAMMAASGNATQWSAHTVSFCRRIGSVPSEFRPPYRRRCEERGDGWA